MATQTTTPTPTPLVAGHITSSDDDAYDRATHTHSSHAITLHASACHNNTTHCALRIYELGAGVSLVTQLITISWMLPL